LLQVQARSLGDPTRFEIFRYLGDAAEPVGVMELARHFGFNPNAIRQHLAKLLDAGMVVEETALPKGRGRPGRVYRQSPAAQARWGGVNPYERLSLLMSEMLRTRQAAIEVGRRAGRRQRLGGGAADTVHTVVQGMERLGFEPDVQDVGDATDVVLRTCPFATAALVDPDNVCQLHLGLAQGLAEGATTHDVEALRTEDPRQGGCVLRLRCRPATDAADDHA